MKVPVPLFALCLLSRAKNLAPKTFLDDFQDFKELIYEEVGPDIVYLFGQYMVDEGMRRAVAFLENKQNLKDLLGRLYECEEFCDLVQFLEENGIDHRRFLDLPSHDIEYNRSQPNRIRTNAPPKCGVGHSGYLRDVISLFPRDKLFDLHLDKMKMDFQFRAMMQELLGDEFWDLWGELLITNTFSMEMGRLRREHDIDFKVLIEYWLALLGFPEDVNA